MAINNLLENLPDALHDELVDVLVQADSVRIERIVSTGHRSPEDFWYDQSENEWVVVLKGEARLVFETNDDPLLLGPGDSVLIRAHERHRVDWTKMNEPTVWLAVFFDENQNP